MRLIDADALIHELNDSYYPGAPYVNAGISIAIGKVLEAPTIRTELKTGKWVRRLVDSGFNADWHCSECGWKTCIEEHGYNFCPNCGADMRGEPND